MKKINAWQSALNVDFFGFGGPCGDRTCDKRIKSPSIEGVGKIQKHYNNKQLQ